MTESIGSERATDRRMLLDHLKLADQHVAESAHRITRQQRVILKLRAKRQTTATAEWFLSYLRTARVVHVVGRSRLLQELADLDEKLQAQAPS